MAVIDGPDGLALVAGAPVDPDSVAASSITVSRVGLEALEITGTLSLVDAAADPAWDGRILLWTPNDPSEYTPARYDLTLNLALVDVAGTPLRGPPAGQDYFHHGQGDIVWSKPSEAPLRGLSAVGNDRFLHGRPYIDSLGLYDHRARFYEPGTQLFLEPDPLGPVDSTNLYQAFGFDGMNVVDPWGMQDDEEGGFNLVGFFVKPIVDAIIWGGETIQGARRTSEDIDRAINKGSYSSVEEFIEKNPDAGFASEAQLPGLVRVAEDVKDTSEAAGRTVLHGADAADRVLLVKAVGTAAAKNSVEAIARKKVRNDLAGSFGGVTARTADEESLLRNVSASFDGSSVFTSAKRFRGNIVVQRSDIPWSAANVRSMARGNTPYVRNYLGNWEQINIHHVGRQEGKLIEILEKQNRYDRVKGGTLHIPGPGGPVRNRSFNEAYWKQRLRDAIDAGDVPDDVLRANDDLLRAKGIL